MQFARQDFVVLARGFLEGLEGPQNRPDRAITDLGGRKFFLNGHACRELGKSPRRNLRRAFQNETPPATALRTHGRENSRHNPHDQPAATSTNTFSADFSSTSSRIASA
jgi:hypothetical protein